MNRRIHILAGLTALGVAGFALSLWTGRASGRRQDRLSRQLQGRRALPQVADRYAQAVPRVYASPAAVAAAKAGKPLSHGAVLTLVQYKAVVGAQGNPVKDARGPLPEGDLVACTGCESATAGAPSTPRT